MEEGTVPSGFQAAWLLQQAGTTTWWSTRVSTPLNLRAVLLVVPEILKHPENPEVLFRVFREPFFCKPISRISHYGFFGQVARGTFNHRFKARGPARPPARPMHRGDRLAMVRPTVPHMPRRAPAPPRGGLPGKHDSWNHCPENPIGFSGILEPGKFSLEVRLEIPGNGSKETRYLGNPGV